jgi:glycosyltransferase involved in cell wall biosynthesis
LGTSSLAEALALGVPCVATNCLSGPRELLADGRYGPLVPVGDAERLAAAMTATLAAPLPADTLRQAVREYRQDVSAAAYLAALGLPAMGLPVGGPPAVIAGT